jgi:hypothetical protein
MTSPSNRKEIFAKKNIELVEDQTRQQEQLLSAGQRNTTNKSTKNEGSNFLVTNDNEYQYIVLPLTYCSR